MPINPNPGFEFPGTETRIGVVYTREILTHKQYDAEQWKRRIG